MTDDSGPESRSQGHEEPGAARSPSGPGTDSARTYLLIAAVLVLLEAVALLVLAGAELADIASDRVAFGVSTAVFFVLVGIGLCGAAYGLWRRISWARGPVVFAQLIQLGLAWSFRDVSPRLIAVTLLVVALGVLGCVLAPATTAALTDDPERPQDS